MKFPFIDQNHTYEWLLVFGAECSARSICFSLHSSSLGFQLPVSPRGLMGSFSLRRDGGGGGGGEKGYSNDESVLISDI